MTLKEGVIVGLLCPRCQTPEENAEAEINAATLTYEIGPDGRIGGRPRPASNSVGKGLAAGSGEDHDMEGLW